MQQNITLPTPKIQARTPNADLMQKAQALGLHPILARIVASRPLPAEFDFGKILAPRLSALDHPLSMQDMAKAAKRVAQAIINNEVIGIETDHDCDGQTSHAVLFHNLAHKFNHPAELIRSYIGHRLEEGYGLSAKVAQRILSDQPRASLVITADNGSADEDRIALLKAQGIDVIVTDHHQLPVAGPPASAYACLNPTRDDCKYPDPYIAGCMVAWLLMAATRLELIELGHLPADSDKITDSLDFVAVGTVADCVSMARSVNNRAIVTYGLKLINAASRPCWRAIKQLVKGQITADDLGFKVGPLLNSDGRLATAFGSVSFLLAADLPEANAWVGHLQEQNHIRKQIQQTITSQGIKIAAEQTALGQFSLCIFLADGHAGVHGIAASRIKDSFGRPTVFLAPKQGEVDLITGSIRSIEGFHVGNAIRWINQQFPGLLLAGGGHAGAGGVTLNRNNYQQFAQAFEQSARQQLTAAALGPVIWTDGTLAAEYFNLDTLNTLAQLEPYGREFENPVFELSGVLNNFRRIGDGSHARIDIILPQQQRVSGVWFNFRADTAQIGEQVKCAITLKNNEFGGIKRCEFQVVYLCKA